MKFRDLQEKSINHANSLALGYDKAYYDKVYNEYLIKEVNLCLKNDNLIDLNEKELVSLLNIYQKLEKDDLLTFINKLMRHSRRRLDYSKVIDIFVNN